MKSESHSYAEPLILNAAYNHTDKVRYPSILMSSSVKMQIKLHGVSVWEGKDPLPSRFVYLA